MSRKGARMITRARQAWLVSPTWVMDEED